MAEQLRVAVSAYQRTRMVSVRMNRGERRRLTVDFNGAIDPARSLVSATFRTNQPHAAYMADAEIAERSTSVELHGQASSVASMRCDATLDDGSVVQQFVVLRVADGPWFEGETSQPSGPRTLTVTV